MEYDFRLDGLDEIDVFSRFLEQVRRELDELTPHEFANTHGIL